MTEPDLAVVREWNAAFFATRDAANAAIGTTRSSSNPADVGAAWREARTVIRAFRPRLGEATWLEPERLEEHVDALSNIEALCDRMIAQLGQTDVPYRVQDQPDRREPEAPDPERERLIAELDEDVRTFFDAERERLRVEAEDDPEG